MKVLAIQGSPRKHGNTAAILKHYLQGIEKSHSDAEVKLINVAEKNIQSCKGCQGCKNLQRKCVINDDMQEIYPNILESDLLILATPIYWWGITAQAKQFLDRFYALNDGHNFKGKKMVLLMTYAGEEPNSGAKIIKNMFNDICDYLEINFVQSYGICTGEVSVQDNPKAQNDVYNLGLAL
ncbi:MAG: flavodoxin family protein [Dehalobacterium sp.]